MLEWDQYGFHRKHSGTRYTELAFLHPVGSMGHVVVPVHPGLKTLTHYFLCSGGNGTDSTKREPGNITPNLCFCMQWDLRVTLCIPMLLGHQTMKHYFFMLRCDWYGFHKWALGNIVHSGVSGTDYTKSMPRHITVNLCFHIRWDPWVT
jgi:hypothetical protein